MRSGKLKVYDVRLILPGGGRMTVRRRAVSNAGAKELALHDYAGAEVAYCRRSAYAS